LTVGAGKEKSETIAHDAMSWLAKLHLLPFPANFEIAYAYCEGANPELSRAIDGLLAKNGPDAFQMADLHSLHFGPGQGEDAVAELSTRMAAELNGVLNVLTTAGKDHSSFGKTLSKASVQLAGAKANPEALKYMIDQVVAATKLMESRSKTLEQQLLASSREISELQSRLETVKQESLTDQLTGIANRKAFDTEFMARIARVAESNQPLSLVMCDIDHFKKFNDTFGHQTGDQVLKLVANCLAENVKGRDTAARYGGEEFAIILPDTGLSAAAGVANKIRYNVESKKLVKKSTGDILGTITISMGVAQYVPGESAEVFIQRADACLYAAKRTGRNRVVGENDRAALTAAETPAA
jgi:diguanylate cyclase